MKSDLEQLIDEIEKEHEALVRQQNECIADADYQGAHYFSGALSYTRTQLEILQNLDNRNFDEIQTLKRQIEHIESLKSGPNENYRIYEHLSRKLPQLREELNNLLLDAFQDRKSDSDEILMAIELLIKKNIDECHILLYEKYNLTLKLYRHKESIILQITYNKDNPFNHYINDRNIKSLRNIGFDTDDNKIEMNFGPIRNQDSLKILEVIGRVTYDVFLLYGNRAAKLILK